MDLLIEMTREVSEDFWVGFQYLIWVMLYVKCQLYIWVAMSSWQLDVQVSQRLKVLLLITDSIFQLHFPSYCVLVLFSGELWKYFETTLFIKNSWLLYQAKFSKSKKILCGGFMLFSFLSLHLNGKLNMYLFLWDERVFLHTIIFFIHSNYINTVCPHFTTVHSENSHLSYCLLVHP